MNSVRIIPTIAMIAGLMAVGLQAQPKVKITGHVNAPEEIREPVRISVVTAENDTIHQVTRMHPDLRLKLKADQVYTLVFEQKGSLTKLVELDARSAVRAYTPKKTRKLNFDVIMERATDEMQYAGPVGKIDFSDRSGRMYIDYDYSMEPIATDGGSRNYPRYEF